MNWLQAHSFMLLTLIYMPCLSTVASLKAESRSIGFASPAIATLLALAGIAAAAFYQSALLLVDA